MYQMERLNKKLKLGINNKMSQNDQILQYLREGNRLTPIDALQLFGCFRLSGRINDLRNMGYDIHTDMVTNGHKTFASYYIPKQEVEIKENKGQYIWTS